MMTILPKFGRELAPKLVKLPLTTALMMAFAACSPQAAEQVPEQAEATAENVHPVSGLEIIPVTVTTSTGTHVIQAELADTVEAQMNGLMFRNEMGPDEGMIFPYEKPEVLSFWMRNTVLPLDLIFIDENRTVINIGDGIPYNEVSVVADREGIAVLELVAGRSEELGIQPGDSVEW